MNTRGQIAIVTDFENILSRAAEDELLKSYSPWMIFRAIIQAIEQIAGGYCGCTVSWRIAAFSLPTISPHNAQDIAGIMRFAMEAEQSGYDILAVQRAASTADHAMTRVALGVLRDPDIKLCILATQDSRSPFSQFLREARFLGKEVHLVGYGYIPQTLQNIDAFPYTLLMGELLEILEQEDTREDLLIPQARTLTQDARAFLKNPGNVSDPEHYEWMVESIRVMERFTQGEWQGTFEQLIQGFKSHWQGPAPPEQSLRAIVRVLANSGRLFWRRSLFMYHPEQPFLRSLRESTL